MYSGKLKILIRRIISSVLFFGCLLLLIGIAKLQPDPKIRSEEAVYYQDDHELEITVVFDEDISYMDITIEVNLYGRTEGLMKTATDYALAPHEWEGNTVVFSVYSYEEVDSYDIVSLDAEVGSAVLYGVWVVGGIVLLFLFVWWIGCLMLSCEIYSVEEREIIVYAGYFHHYISVDGEKYDEENTLVSFSPIWLSCTVEGIGTLEAKISLSNRISLKINDKLYKNRRR